MLFHCHTGCVLLNFGVSELKKKKQNPFCIQNTVSGTLLENTVPSYGFENDYALRGVRQYHKQAREKYLTFSSRKNFRRKNSGSGDYYSQTTYQRDHITINCK